MSWKPEVQVMNEPDWHGNARRFATEAEALASAKNLMARWTLVEQCRATESADPVNCKWVGDRAVAI